MKSRSLCLRRWAATFSLAASCLLTTPSALFAKDEVMVKLTASKVTADQDGKEKLASADEAKPGDVLQYDALYRNETKGEVRGLEATVPIPAGLELLPNAIKPAGARASADGQKFAAMPLLKKAVGEEKPAPLPLSEYRALRWTIPQLAPGAATTVTLRARVLTNLPLKNIQP